MSLETTTTVSKLDGVKDEDGTTVPAMSGADYIARIQGADISGGGIDIDPNLPGRPERIVVLVEASAAFAVTFEYLDANDNVDLDRGPAENSDLESTDGSQLFIVHTPADAEQVQVNIADTSGGANTADGRVFAA